MLSTSWQQNFAPKLNRHTSRVLSEITEGKYKEVRADNVYNLTLIDSKGEAISADYF